MSRRDMFSKEELMDILPKRYKFIQDLSSGYYGQVVKCLDLYTQKNVVVKIPLHEDNRVDLELSILTKLKEQGLDDNIVKLLDSFKSEVGDFLVFECLQSTLVDYMKNVEYVPLSTLRNIIQQMATALNGLKSLSMRVVHTDIKVDNIMLTDPPKPLKYKLIDFGNAWPETDIQWNKIVCPLAICAPEVLLGLRVDVSFDVWSLGVAMTHLLIKTHLFPNSTDYMVMRAIVKLLGQPSDDFLEEACKTRRFFQRSGKSWKILSTKEFAERFEVEEETESETERFSSLGEMIKHLYAGCGTEDETELDKCIDLLGKMLRVNPALRITSEQIHLHPFIVEVSSARRHPYEPVRSLWSEPWGEMRLCQNKNTSEQMWLKKPHDKLQAQKEASLFKSLKGLHEHIIEFMEIIEERCLIFESGGIRLSDVMSQNCSTAVLHPLAIIVKKITESLAALHSRGIIHCDVRPEIIGLKGEGMKPEIKIIDLQCAIHQSDVRAGMEVQRVNYRAPEVILGLPFTEAIDIWSLGATMAKMLLGFDLFPDRTESDTLKVIVNYFGQPSEDILEKSIKTKDFFKRPGKISKLLTNRQHKWWFNMSCGEVQHHSTEKFSSLYDLIKAHLEEPVSDEQELCECVDLMDRMFKVNPTERITPEEILTHPFILRYDSFTEERTPAPVETVGTGDNVQHKGPRIIKVKPPTTETEINVFEEDDKHCKGESLIEKRTLAPVIKVYDFHKSRTPDDFMPRIIEVKPAAPENTTVYKEDDQHQQSEPCTRHKKTQTPAPKKKKKRALPQVETVEAVELVDDVQPKSRSSTPRLIEVQPAAPENTSVYKEDKEDDQHQSEPHSKKKKKQTLLETVETVESVETIELVDDVQPKSRSSTPRLIEVKPAAPENTSVYKEDDQHHQSEARPKKKKKLNKETRKRQAIAPEDVQHNASRIIKVKPPTSENSVLKEHCESADSRSRNTLQTTISRLKNWCDSESQVTVVEEITTENPTTVDTKLQSETTENTPGVTAQKMRRKKKKSWIRKHFSCFHIED